MRRSLPLSVRIYRVLLLGYPQAFRQRFGDEMVQVFRDCCRDALDAQGVTGMVLLWLHTLPDLAITAAKERLIASGYTGAKPMDTNLALHRQIVSTFDFMSHGLRSGYSIRQCLSMIAKYAPEPTATEIRQVLADMEQSGNFVGALTGFKTRLDSPYLSRLIDIMLRQLQEGGNLADKLDNALGEVPAEIGRDTWLNEAIEKEGIGKN